MNKPTAKKIIKKIEKAADLLFEANQMACQDKKLEHLKSPTCYLVEIIETMLENLGEQ